MAEDSIHALMIVSAVATNLKTTNGTANLQGTFSDKIHVEDFCYNHQNYHLHKTVQLSEGLNEVAPTKPKLVQTTKRKQNCAEYNKTISRTDYINIHELPANRFSHMAQKCPKMENTISGPEVSQISDSKKTNTNLTKKE